MEGTVVLMNKAKGFIAVQTEAAISVIEILGSDEVNLGETISGNQNHGGETLRNETQRCDLSVFIQGVHCTPDNAKNLMA